MRQPGDASVAACRTTVRTGIGLIPLLVLLLSAAHALTIQKQVPPPFQLSIEDLCAVTIVSPESTIVWVRATATEGEKGLVARVTTEQFPVRAGTNRFDAAHLPPIREAWVMPAVEQLVRRTGQLPEGDYTLLVELFTADGSRQGDDRIRHQVRHAELLLITPPDNSDVRDPTPVFRWSLSREIPDTRYALRIGRLPAHQTPAEALAGAPWFEQTDIASTSFRYPTSARPLEPGRYVWQVLAQVGTVTLSRSAIWLFEIATAPAPESCQYYVDEKGKMWHALGREGVLGIPPKLCTYILTRDSIMRHANGTGWDTVRVDSCTSIRAENGVFHYDGHRWRTVPGVRCHCLLTRQGMLHYDGRTWVPVPPESCSYVVVQRANRLYHADGRGWTAIPADSCSCYLTRFGMYHFDGKRWDRVTGRECMCILAQNGMFHFDGENWVAVAPDSCTYALVTSPVTGRTHLYHADGRTWTAVTFPLCTYIKAANGVFHFNGQTWDRIRLPACSCVLTHNGMYHFDGKTWRAVRPDSCTYAFVTDPVRNQTRMYHADGKTWTPVNFPRCTYLKARNGLFHFNGQTWDPIRLPTCSYLLAHNGMFHFDGTAWVPVTPDSCTYVLTQDPVRRETWMYHANGREWVGVRVERCNYVFARNGMYHFNGKTWVDKTRAFAKCQHVYCRLQDRMYHFGDSGWELVPGTRGKTIGAANGSYTYDPDRGWVPIPPR